MEIPEELRNLDFETYDAISALVVPEKKGEIISITALVEEEVTKFFAADSPPSKTLLKKSLSDKIKSLDSKFSASENHQAEKVKVLDFLRALLAIRNLGAHTYEIGFPELTQREEDHPGIKSMLLDCPTNLWTAVKEFKAHITAITN
jgi:hypothetical protein